MLEQPHRARSELTWLTGWLAGEQACKRVGMRLPSSRVVALLVALLVGPLPAHRIFANGLSLVLSFLFSTIDFDGVLRSQNRSVSSPAPVTIVSPSGLIAR